MISKRTTIGWVLICFAFFSPQVSAQQSRGTTYAFLVGCSGYNRSELKALPYTINDVSGFADSLLATGVASENIKLLHDKRTDNSGRFLPEKEKILKELKLLIAGIDRQDTLIVALSGHGVHFVGDKVGYFCPRDARLADRKTLIPMEGEGGLYTILKDCPATRKLLLVNACRNDPASDVAQAAKKVNLDDLDTDNVPEGIVALYSCRQGQESYYDPDRKLGIFFDHVNQAWLGKYQTTSEPLTLDMFFEQVKSRTKADADRLYEKPQIPIPKREFSGEWIVNRPGIAKSKSNPPSAPTSPKTLTSRTTGMELVLIPSGTFTMGSPKTEPDRQVDEGQHQVTISKDFYLGKTEVTQSQWTSVMGTSPWKRESYVKEGANYPATNVSWDDAVEFCIKLSAKDGKEYRLPTEAEWEYACRSRSQTAYSFGDAGTRLSDYAWWGGIIGDGNAKQEQYAHEVGTLRPNGFGLYDMHGNVWEWCNDWYDEKYYASSASTDPPGPKGGSYRVNRGGSWSGGAALVRSSNRNGGMPGNRSHYLGFRVASSSVQ